MSNDSTAKRNNEKMSIQRGDVKRWLGIQRNDSILLMVESYSKLWKILGLTRNI